MKPDLFKNSYLKSIIVFLVIFFTIYGVRTANHTYDFIIHGKEYYPDYPRVDGYEELVLTYIGSSSCPFCNTPTVDSTLTSLSKEIKDYSMTNKINYTFIGLSNEKNKIEGVKHLLRLGINFDEISMGNEWENTSLRYYTNTFKSEYATPQIVLSKRTYSDSLSKSPWVTVTDEIILGRYIGIDKFETLDLAKAVKNLN
ncbi:MAG: hypothetical protein FH748_10805 [Balneolaceae bacterium]|nr:hypothetical protein [Balneolaceae bacterium]